MFGSFGILELVIVLIILGIIAIPIGISVYLHESDDSKLEHYKHPQTGEIVKVGYRHCWYAFTFSPIIYFFYKRLYLYALIVLLGNVITLSSPIGPVVNILVAIFTRQILRIGYLNKGYEKVEDDGEIITPDQPIKGGNNNTMSTLTEVLYNTIHVGDIVMLIDKEKIREFKRMGVSNMGEAITLESVITYKGEDELGKYIVLSQFIKIYVGDNRYSIRRYKN